MPKVFYAQPVGGTIWTVEHWQGYCNPCANTYNMKLRIRGLPADMDKYELWDWLRPFPGIQASWVVLDRINQKSKRTAIILVERAADGMRIQKALNGLSLEEDKVIRVEVVPIREK